MSIFASEQDSALNYIRNGVNVTQVILAINSPAVANLKKALQNVRDNTVQLTRKQATELVRLATSLCDDRERVDTKLIERPTPLSVVPNTNDSSKMSIIINKQLVEIKGMLNRVHVNSPYRARLQTLTNDLCHVYTENKLMEFFQLYKEYMKDETKQIQNLDKIFSDIKNIENEQKSGSMVETGTGKSKNDDGNSIENELNETDTTEVNYYKEPIQTQTPSSNQLSATKLTIHTSAQSENELNNILNPPKIPNAPPMPPPPPSFSSPPPPPPPSESTISPPLTQLHEKKSSTIPPPMPSSESMRDQMMLQIKQGVKLKPVVKQNNKINEKQNDLIETINPDVQKKDEYQLQGTNYVKANAINLKDVLNKRLIRHKMIESEAETTQSENDEINDFDDNNISLNTVQNNAKLKKCLSSILFLVRNEENLRSYQNINEVSDINKLLNAETESSLQLARQMLKEWQKKLLDKFKNYKNPLLVKGILEKPIYLQPNVFKIAIDDLINREEYQLAYDELEIYSQHATMNDLFQSYLKNLRNIINHNTSFA
ncbi:ORF-2 [Buzura suppressaria nucleopolyhedrovirus]|uniref:ORF-2 n=1 Tax=Buzura suppressaria nuclear polyhedrosis virus TaxID=74320 RepID=W5VKA1_NPVBS|nr:ORF-2 [Buzura suppressaria nucleopolyhedrovirus]AHH82591.1 ORF-2 [Buzura suppressaria nucleopolyhedrovirus]AKN90972.1 P78/83 [Buzura suppressaria nucleopolyhedrovirus]QYF10588.1 pp78/83 [Buzura suppressaria nucleopolyhedrovirus]